VTCGWTRTESGPLITSAKGDMQSSLFVCWQLCAKTSERICMKFSDSVGNGPMNNWLNLGGDLDHRLDTGIVFRIHHYWEIRKVVNGHKSAAHTDLPDSGTGKTYLGGGMQCPSPSWTCYRQFRIYKCGPDCVRYKYGAGALTVTSFLSK